MLCEQTNKLIDSPSWAFVESYFGLLLLSYKERGMSPQGKSCLISYPVMGT